VLAAASKNNRTIFIHRALTPKSVAVFWWNYFLYLREIPREVEKTAAMISKSVFSSAPEAGN
jgi:hypothetical protein